MKLTEYRPHKFGHLGIHIKNQIFYTLSAFEQDHTKGFISKGLPNLFRRIRNNFFPVAIPAALYYALYKHTINTQAKMDRKNPKDYENDV